LKYLYKNAGVRTLVMEFGFSRAWLVDNYINSQDTSYAKILRIYSFKEYSDFYKKLREFNLTLPLDQRIHVVGIDVERFSDLLAKVLSLQLPKTNPSDTIIVNIEALRGISGFLDEYLLENKQRMRAKGSSSFGSDEKYISRTYSVAQTLNSIVEDFDKNKFYYKEYLGENFQNFEKIILEIKDQGLYELYNNQTQQYVFRENYMYHQFLNYHILHPNEKIFGQFGRCHVASSHQQHACNWYDFDPLASKINSSADSSLVNKVCSFAYFYKEDETFRKTIAENGVMNKILNKAAELDTFVAIMTNDDSLFFGDFHKMYKFIIFNGNSMADESEQLEYNADINDNSTENTESFFSIYAGWQKLSNKYNNLNNFLLANNFSTISFQPDYVQFGMQINSLKNLCVDINVSILPQIKINNSTDTITVAFSGYNFAWNYGWNFLNSKYFFMKPNIGFGISNNKLIFSESKSKVIPNKDIFGGNQTDIFNKNAFILDFGIEGILKYKFIGIGVKYGYLWDTSKGYWSNMDNKILPSSAPFKVSGQYLSAAIHFIFDL